MKPTVKNLLLVLTLSTTAACATPGQPPDRAVPVQASDSTDPAGNEVLAAGAPAQEFAGTENSAAAGVTGIEAVEPPQPHETPAEMLPRVHVDEPEVVCTREVPTGSRLAVEVCREVSDVERRQDADQRLLDEIKTNSAIGASRL